MKAKHRTKRIQRYRKMLGIIVLMLTITLIGVVVSATVLYKRKNACKTPDTILVEYMMHIPKQEYEEMYAMIDLESSGYISKEDFLKRNSTIFEGIEMQNMSIKYVEYVVKYISFRPLDRELFVRGSTKSLGAEYTKERIKERLEAKVLTQTQKRVPFPARKKPLIKDYSSKRLIDTSEEKFTQSPGLQHWAAIENLKIAASSYSKAGSIIELEKQIESIQ